MPVTPAVNYPGVYIQEVESPVHTIAPVATSTTAFVGAALRGPINSAVLVHSYADFERFFGGLTNDSRLGFAVNDFFLNGGSDAVIVRVAAADAAAANLNLSAGTGTLPLVAVSEGAWGNSLKATVSYPLPESAKPGEDAYDALQHNLAGPLGVEVGDLFNLTIIDGATKRSEMFTNVTVNKGHRTIDRVLENESHLVRVAKGTDLAAIAARPKEGKVDATKDSGADGGAIGSNEILGNEDNKTGIYALKDADIFNLLIIAPYPVNGELDVEPGVLSAAAKFCVDRRAVLLVDPPANWRSPATAKQNFPIQGFAASANAAVYYPRIKKANPIRGNQLEYFGPAGTVAGVIARTDRQRGVWKAPAGLEATLSGVYDFDYRLTDAENGDLNPLGINCLRIRPGAGPVIWGARTTVGADQLASQWKYLPVRRLALFLEESLYRGMQWAVFEPNDEPLWAQIRLNVGVFLHDLFRQGAFQGQSPKEAYFVQCDHSTTTQSDIDRGIVNVIVGFAPLKPAEFVVLYFQQIAGQLAT